MYSNRILLANDPKDNFVKPNDIIISQYVANLRDRSLIFMVNGDCAVVPNSKIPECKYKEVGTHINNLVSSAADNKVVAAINADYKQAVNKQQVVVVTASGLIKRCELSEFITKRASTINYAKLDEGDKIVSVFSIDNEQQKIIICSKNGYINSYEAAQVPLVGKGAKGVKAMGLKGNDKIACAFALTPDCSQIAVVTNYAIKRINTDIIPTGNRANLGKPLSSFITSFDGISVIKILPLIGNATIVYVDTTEQKQYISLGEINYLDYASRIYSLGNEIINANIWIAKVKDSESANE